MVGASTTESCNSNHCGLGECPNWYIENGVQGCLKKLRPSASFKASASPGNPQDPYVKLFSEAEQLLQEYRVQLQQSRKLAYAALKSRINSMIKKATLLHAEQEVERIEKRAKQARRCELEIQHPWGWMSDLGAPMSNQALEAGAAFGKSNNVLANPAKMEALRLLAMGA